MDFYELDIDMGAPAAYHIGTRVTLTNCRLLTHDAAITKATGCVRMGHIFIGDDVYVGAGAIILPNVSIGNKVIIGAGSVVAKDIPDNSVVVGNPCKIIHSFDETISKNMKNMRKNPACTRKELSSKFQRAKQQDGFYYIKVTDKYDGLFENLSE